MTKSESPCRVQHFREIPTHAQGVGTPKRMPLYMGVQDTKEFLSDAGGYRTRWPILVAASLFAVCVIAYWTSHVLSGNAGAAPWSIIDGQAASETEEGAPSAQTAPEDAIQAVEMQTMMQGGDRAEKRKKGFAFSLQSEAEAAQESDFRVDVASVAHSKGLTEARKRVLFEQVHDLLRSASEAVRDENLDLFLAHLDENETDLVRTQKLKTRIAFRQFDKIDGEYSDVKIRVLNENELAVDLHCRVQAAFAKSGRLIVLFDGDQSLTLRKAAGAVWKICAIE